MGILYIDEAGNSGVKDTAQPNLLYGGPYIEPTQWKTVMADFYTLESKYKSMIYAKFNKPLDMPQSFEKLSSQIKFFGNFHFHAAEIINGKHLWGKLSENQRFQLLEDMIIIMKSHNVKFIAGILNKQKFLQKFKTGESFDSMGDFATLLPLYFDYFEKNIGDRDNYVVVIADGDAKEKAILHKTLQEEYVKKCVPELFIYSADDVPMLQLADAGLWTIQAYHRLEPSDTSTKAQRIRALYQQIHEILNLYTF
jgi:hypothetical protein